MSKASARMLVVSAMLVQTSSIPVDQIGALTKAQAAISVLPRVEVPDRSRGTTIPTRVTHPSAAGTYPVVVWSPFAGGSKDDYTSVVRQWAAAGYIVVQTSHFDEPLPGGSWGPEQTRNLPNRFLDLVTVLDHLDGLIPASTGVQPDTSRIGVGGHYVGSVSALALGGMFDPSSDRRYSDARPLAFVAVSPTGREGTLSEATWASIDRPVLVITGPQDLSARTSHEGLWRTEAYRFMPAGGKYLVLFDGAGGTYLDAYELGPELGLLAEADARAKRAVPVGERAGVVQCLAEETLAFWDLYVKGDSAARARLRQQPACPAAKGLFSIEWK